MLQKIENKLLEYIINEKVWTNVYGVARSIIALSFLLTLLINDTKVFFRPTSDLSEFPVCSNVSFGLFCIIPTTGNYIILEVIRFVSIIILLLVVIGWRPKFTGILHWYIMYSWNTAAITLDGGEQVSSVITFLLIPITLTDHRKWHWTKLKEDEHKQCNIYIKALCIISYWFIRVQIAILYLHSTVAKVFEEEWINGTAVYYFLEDPIFGLNPYLHKIFDYFLTSPLIILPTWGTLIIQISLFGALFVNKKYWKYFLLVAIFMHEIFAVILGLISFSLVMLGVLILYLRPLDKEFSSIHIKNKIYKRKEEEVA